MPVGRKPGRPKGSKNKKRSVVRKKTSGSKKAYYGVSFRKPSTKKQASKRQSVITRHVYHYGEVAVPKKYLLRNYPKRRRVSKK